MEELNQQAPLEKWPTSRAMAAYALKRGLNQLSKFATSPRLYMLHTIDVGRGMDLRRRRIARKRKLEALQSQIEDAQVELYEDMEDEDYD
jgi:hypothetical protein